MIVARTAAALDLHRAACRVIARAITATHADPFDQRRHFLRKVASPHPQGDRDMPTPRYRLEALEFKCLDESGVDIFGSDEPKWFFTWTSGKAPKTVASREFGDIDSGDTRRWTPALRITPAGGVPGPLALSIQLYEIDQGNPDKMRTAVEAAVTTANLVAMAKTGKPLPFREAITKQLVDLLGNDLMGSSTVAFSSAELTKRLSRPGTSLVRTVKMGGKSGDLPFEVAGGPDYQITFRVLRERDAN
jgi:hypothetical protein